MYDSHKKILHAIGCLVAGIVLFVTVLLCTGCRTTGVDRRILEYQKQVDRLEEELRTRDRTIDSAIRELAAITERSSSMETDIDTVIRLFDEYQRAAERLLYCYRNTEAADSTKK